MISAATIAFLTVLLLAILMIATSVKVVPDSRRLAMYRMGRFLRVAGPGFVLLLPFVDRAEDIHLNDAVPSWRSLSPSEIDAHVRAFLLSKGML